MMVVGSSVVSGVDVTISAKLGSGTRTMVTLVTVVTGLVPGRRPAKVKRERANATANRPPSRRRVWLPAIGRSSTYENAHPSRSTRDARNPSTRSRRDLVSTVSLRSNARSDFTRSSSKSLGFQILRLRRKIRQVDSHAVYRILAQTGSWVHKRTGTSPIRPHGSHQSREPPP